MNSISEECQQFTDGPRACVPETGECDLGISASTTPEGYGGESLGKKRCGSRQAREWERGKRKRAAEHGSYRKQQSG
jgi:hypothetical protein